jgi:DNA polymerase (family 10)
LIGQRDGLPLDFSKLFTVAARVGVAMEINSGYPRLDLNDQNARAAVAAGVMLTIDTDAHSVEGLKGIGWGIGVARRAWVEKRSVVNCMGFEGLKGFLEKKR